ncbi:MAG: glycosyltransferase [Myxococcota bacterium]
MRVALAVEGTRGDVFPMLALGERLTAGGHEVLVCAPPDFEAAARARGLEFHAVGVAVRSYLVEHAHVLTRGGISMVAEGTRYSRRCIDQQLAALPRAFEGVDFAFGAGVQLGAATAAEARGIPYRYVAYCPALLPSSHHAPFTLERQDLAPWANRLAWRLSRLGMNAALRPPVNRARRGLGLPPVGDVVVHMLTDRPILAADRELAPAPPESAARLDQVPCLHPFEPEPLPDKLASFLDAGPPPVYLGFGSMTDPDPATTTARLLRAIRSLGLRAVIARGWAGLGEGPVPDGVFVTDPVSHAALFPRMAAVVHHGGAGTTTTAARAGVPQVLVPHVLDQFYWAKRVQELGLGPPAVARRGLSAESLAGAIAQTVDAEVCAERASELGAALRARAEGWQGVDALLSPPCEAPRPQTPPRLDRGEP